MPKNKRISDDDTSDTSIEDSPPPKKSKSEKSQEAKKSNTSKASSSSSSKSKKSDDREPSWQLENKRFVKVREFRGRVFVDIREFYEGPSGDLLPGKKGISLSAAQWNKLQDISSEITEALKNA